MRLALVVGMLLVATAPTTASAQDRVRFCEEHYLPAITFDRTLPAGVQVKVDPARAGLSDTIELRFSNRAQEPVLLVAAFERSVDWRQVVPPEGVVWRKLVDGIAHDWVIAGGWRVYSRGGATADEIFAWRRSRPWEVEMRRRPARSGRATIERDLVVQAIHGTRPLPLRFHGSFDVDFDQKAQLKLRATLDPGGLPPGVGLRTAHGPLLENTGKTPLYLYARAREAAEWATLPKHLVPIAKLAGGRARYAAVLGPESTDRVEKGWLAGNASGLLLPFHDFVWLAKLKLAVGKGPGRDTAKPLPAPQRFALPIWFRGRQAALTGLIRYRWNPHYRDSSRH